jgi:hypothetical protein
MRSRPIENAPLVADLVQWVANGPRPYAEVMEVWRTSCPRLPVWEEAVAQGFVERTHSPGHGATVRITLAGQAFLGSQDRSYHGTEETGYSCPT